LVAADDCGEFQLSLLSWENTVSTAVNYLVTFRLFGSPAFVYNNRGTFVILNVLKAFSALDVWQAHLNARCVANIRTTLFYLAGISLKKS